MANPRLRFRLASIDGRVPYLVANAQGRVNRRLYSAAIRAERLRPVVGRATADHEYVTFSGAANVPEQVASLRSYLRYAGSPSQVRVISDGTHTAETKRALETQCPTVSVVHWRDVAGDMPPALERYAAAHPLGIKLAVMRRLGRPEPVLFTDSDVLFFPKAAVIAAIVHSGQATCMGDCTPHGGDLRLAARWTVEESANSGFLVLSPDLDWEYGLYALTRLEGAPHWNTEQTICHLVLRRARAQRLDAERFVVTVEDKWRLGDAASPVAERAARHYVGPVRHKMWQMVGRQELLPSLRASVG